MATFEERVEAMSGGISDSGKLPEWLSDGARDVITRIRFYYPEQLPRFATEETVDDTTGYVATNGGFVVSLYTTSGVSLPIPAEDRFYALNTDSIKAATVLHPRHWVLNGTYFIAADGETVDGKASVVAVNRTIAASDTSIDDFATEFEHLVAMYAGIQNLTLKLEDLSAEVDTIILPAPPDTDFTISKDLTDALRVCSPDFPEFTLPDKPTITDIEFTDITPPTAPIAPSFTMPSLTLPTAPTYTPPTNILNITTALSQIETNINTTEDLEIATTNLQKVNSLVNEYVAKMNDAVNTFNEENAEFQGAIQIAIEQARLLNTAEASEYAAELQKYATESSNYAAQVTALVNIFTASNVQYKIMMWQTESQIELNTYQAQVSALLQLYSNDISNNSNFTEAEVKLYASELSEAVQKNQAKLGVYAGQINGIMSEIQKLSEKRNLLTLMLQKLSSQYENAWIRVEND